MNTQAQAHAKARYYTVRSAPDLCEDCNSEPPVDKHHEDYAKPLEILWLCRSCHTKRHPRTKARGSKWMTGHRQYGI